VKPGAPIGDDCDHSGLGDAISGAILYDETIRSRRKMALPLLRHHDTGIIPASRLTPAQRYGGHPGEKITEGLDGLRDRLAEYSQMAPDLPKWRAVIAVGEGIPSRVASRPTRTRWLATPRCARKPDWSPSSSRNAHGRRAYLERCCEVTEEVCERFPPALHPRVTLEGMPS